jgi:hypothetical protein
MFIVNLVYRERQISVGLVPLILWRGIVADLLLPRGRQRTPLYRSLDMAIPNNASGPLLWKSLIGRGNLLCLTLIALLIVIIRLIQEIHAPLGCRTPRSVPLF